MIYYNTQIARALANLFIQNLCNRRWSSVSELNISSLWLIHPIGNKNGEKRQSKIEKVQKKEEELVSRRKTRQRNGTVETQYTRPIVMLNY